MGFFAGTNSNLVSLATRSKQSLGAFRHSIDSVSPVITSKTLMIIYLRSEYVVFKFPLSKYFSLVKPGLHRPKLSGRIFKAAEVVIYFVRKY